MATDRGGLQYKIEVQDAFSARLERFRRELAESAAAWAAFQRQLKQTRAASRRAKKKATERQEARKEIKREKQRLREETKNFNARAEAIKKVNKETRKQATAQAAASVSSKQQFNNEKRLLTATEQRQAAEKRLTAVLNKRKVVQANLLAVQARGVKLTEEEAIKLGLASKIKISAAKKLTELEQQKLTLQKLTERANDKELQQITAQTAALRIKAAAQQRAAVASILAGEGLDPSGKPISAARPSNPRQGARDFNQLNTAMDRAGKTANRISFTFRRLFGILAAFAAARAAVAGFNQLVASAIRLNAELEESALGVAGLLTALGNVSDPSGTIADNAERLNLAQGAARRQLELLRVEALKTSATFQELADTFQVALAPGFQAGLDLDEIRRLTVRISQAAGAIGLPQNQLPEEIRSLLTGTITPRTTRIATALGITNEDIRNAKEAGELVEFLDQKFAAFAVAGDAALKNFNTILINLKDGLSQILRIGGFEFFDALKKELNGLLGLIATVDETTNQIVFNPEAIKVVEAITEGLRAAVVEAGRIGDALDLKDAQNIAKLIGKAIAGVARTAGPLLEALIKALSLLGNVVDFLTSLGIVNDLVLSILANALIISSVLRTMAVVFGTIKVGLPVVAAQLKLIRGLVFGVSQGAISARVAIGVMLRSLLVIAPVLAIISLAFTGLRSQADNATVASQDLVNALSQVPVAISRSNTELAEQAELVKRLQERFESAANSFEVSVGTAGLSGAVAEQRRQAIQLQQETRDIQRQTLAEQTRLLNTEEALTRKRAEAEAALSDLRAQGGLDVIRVNQQMEESREIQDDIVDLEARILHLQEAGTDQANARIETLEEELHLLRQRRQELANTLKRNVAFGIAAENVLDRDTLARSLVDLSGDALRNLSDDLSSARFGELFSLENFGVSPDTEEIAEAEQKIKSIQEQLDEVNRLEAERQSILQQQLNLQDNQLQLQIAQGQVRALQSRQAAEDLIGPFGERTSSEFVNQGKTEVEGNFTQIINEQNNELRVQLALRQRLQQSVEALGNVQQTEAENELVRQQQAMFFLQERGRLAIEAVQRTQEENSLAAARAQADLDALFAKEELTDAEIRTAQLLEDQLALLRQEEIALKQQVGVLERRNELLEADQQINIDEALKSVKQTKDTLDNVYLGFKEGLERANEEVKTAFEISARTTLKAVQGLSGLIADTIVDAFDPTSDASLEQRIGQFFQSIARMLIQLTTQALLLRLVLGGIFGGGSISGAPQAVTSIAAAAGGLIPDMSKAPGYATGGTVGRSPMRPKGIAASDTTPAWLTPGEFVVKKSAVGAYGADAIAAINDMLIDPGSLRALAGLTSRSRASAKRGRLGFADGGVVGRGSSQQQPEPAQQAPMPMVAIPADDATIETLFAGGQNAVFSFMQSNRNRIKAALGV